MAYLWKAKGQKKKITEKLAELEVNPSKRTKLTSQCFKLCEGKNTVVVITLKGILRPVSLFCDFESLNHKFLYNSKILKQYNFH